MSTNLLLVGATFKIRSDEKSIRPEFKTPKAEADWLNETAAQEPYTGTLATFCAAALSEVEDVFSFRYFHCGPNSTKDCVVDFAGHFDNGPTQFFETWGFQVRPVLKILALEAAEKGASFPRTLWFGPDAKYYDIENVVAPEKNNTFKQAAARLLPPGIADREHTAKHKVALTALLLERLQLFPELAGQLRAVVEKFTADKVKL